MQHDDSPELYWAAGFFDGEGSIAFARNGNHRKVIITVPQTSIEPLERFQNAVRVGRIYGSYERTKNHLGHKRYWIYQCQAQEEVQQITELLFPLLCTAKREQMSEAMSKFRKYEETRPATDRSEASRKGWVTRRAKAVLIGVREQR